MVDLGMIELLHFTEDDKGELTADHVFYSHLQKRDNLISELYGLSSPRRVTRIKEIKYEDSFLTEFLKAREIFGITIPDEMNKYKPFDLKKFEETLLTEDNLDDALWTIAEECREWKKIGYFTKWRSAYRHGAMQLTKLGKKTTWQNLETEWSKYKTEGRKEINFR